MNCVRHSEPVAFRGEVRDTLTNLIADGADRFNRLVFGIWTWLLSATIKTTDYFLKCFPMLFLERHKCLSLSAARRRKPPIIT
jgi:hypothetical protein